MSGIVVPKGMLDAVREVTPYIIESERVNILKKALRWLSENPIVPVDDQLDSISSSTGHRFIPATDSQDMVTLCVEWQRRMFLDSEKKVLLEPRVVSVYKQNETRGRNTPTIEGVTRQIRAFEFRYGISTDVFLRQEFCENTVTEDDAMQWRYLREQLSALQDANGITKKVFYSIKDVANITGKCYRTIHRRVKEGKISPVIHMGASIMIPRQVVERIIKKGF